MICLRLSVHVSKTHVSKTTDLVGMKLYHLIVSFELWVLYPIFVVWDIYIYKLQFSMRNPGKNCSRVFRQMPKILCMKGSDVEINGSSGSKCYGVSAICYRPQETAAKLCYPTIFGCSVPIIYGFQ